MFRVRVSIVLAFVVSAIIVLESETGQGAPPEDSEAVYTKTITERATKIVTPLGIDDAAKAARVRDLIVEQYSSLREIHDARDAKISETKNAPSADRTVADAWTKVARDTADLKLIGAHRRFVARLSVDLTPEQVDKVKDGMTYSVVPITYKGYLQLLPDLKEVQKREILANLVEAREYAMDAGSSEEKHALFGKYKGRINSYLSAAGFNLKQAEKDRAAKQRGASQNR